MWAGEILEGLLCGQEKYWRVYCVGRKNIGEFIVWAGEILESLLCGQEKYWRVYCVGRRNMTVRMWRVEDEGEMGEGRRK